MSTEAVPPRSVPPDAVAGAITFLSTRDLEATSRFYGEILALPLALDQGDCRIWKAGTQAYVGFCRRERPPVGPGLILTFLVDDVAAWQARLEEAGVPIDKPAARNPTYDIVHLFCRDPNGTVVELQRFVDPDWDRSGA